MKILILLFSLIPFFFSCSSGDKTKGKTEAEVLYKDALKDVEDQRFLMATEKLNNIKSQYPYSFYATHAELLLADILFKQESYIESAAAFMLFRDLHPKHERLAYVVWMIAESYYNQLPSTFDRDLSGGVQSIDYYNEIIQKFPNSEYLDQAREKIKTVKELVEKKEQYIADFYFKTKVFDSARFRYLIILESFTSAPLLSHASVRIVESSYKLKEFDKCLDYAEKLKNYFQDEKISTVKSLVEKCKNGLN